MKNKILTHLENDARLTPVQLAVMLGTTEEKVRAVIDECEAEGSILSYRTVINWDKTGKESVIALIELKTIPQKDRGFDCVAEKIANFPEVKSVYLMSGGFDLALTLECRTMRDVAVFVAEKLATIEGVTSTATHFVLQKYKDNDVIFEPDTTDKRGNTW
ncbi:MAG: AsnC family transcriptional regulator [Clostridiales bacterium GWF2_36_10]|nr:MAG: AsnC family transcriptional regulator [Clostridiales bacterium GWF2_36_10]HAN21320.1 AsnC family transcriptional regulator [Clostridiales bacterium]